MSVNARFIQDACGSEDGFTTQYFTKGDVVAIGEALAEQFDHAGAIEIIKVQKTIHKKASPVQENKAKRV